MATNDLSTASTVVMQCEDDDQTQTSRNTTGNVSAIYARLPFPEMCNTNVEAWFISMEFWFSASGISSDKQKAATVLAALKPETIAQLTDVISTLPPSDRFEYVKRRIIDHFADSEQRRLNRLLSEMPLGDKKPSELFFEMKRVAGNSGEAAIKGLWTKRLPTFAQPVVAASTGTAAEFTKIAVSPSQVCKVSKEPTTDMNELRTAIMELSKKFEQFTTRSRSRSRRPTVTRHRSQHRQSSSDGTTSSNFDECWYRKKYGRNARKCRSPCKHKQRQVHAVTAQSSN
ncbi:uncharacterized protein LOC135950571 [Calliphora vicina]|uniref:uncharacterized protein LOC135950571 n=1 Tax=Calliphora vicina TaxID=7373 RepID=UPI00325B8BBC